MKKTFITLLAILCCTTMLMANGVKIKGIHYILSNYNQTATVTYTGKYASSKNTYAGDIVVPATVTYRGKTYNVTEVSLYAFNNCEKLTSVTFSEGIKTIGETFDKCPMLTSVVIPVSAQKVDLEKLNNCPKITEPIYNAKRFIFMPKNYTGKYEIPKGIEIINSCACKDCKDLTAIVLPNSVKTIEANAFLRCSGLTSVTLPKSLEEIRYGAFGSIPNLKNLSLPQNVTKVSGEAFTQCTSLTHIYVDPKNATYCDIDGVVFTKDMTTIVAYPAGKPGTHYTIPYDVTQIGKYAFNYCTNLTSITLPEGLKTIGDYAFSNCKSLSDIRIPNGVTEIGGCAFWYCTSLTSIVVPNTVTKFGSSVFCGCKNLKSANIPSSITEIKWMVFDGCKNLKSILIPNKVTKVDDSAFRSCSSLTEIKYPGGLKLALEGVPSSVRFVSYNRNNPPQDVVAAMKVTVPAAKTVQTNRQPPLLSLVDGSLSFSDPSKNNRIEAGEKCTISFKIKNTGKGMASNCEARVHLSGMADGIQVQTVKLSTIYVNQTTEVSVPVTATNAIKSGNVTFSIEIVEPSGWGVSPFDITVATKAYEPPYLQVVDYNIASNSGKIRKMEPFTLTFNLQNTKYGDAEDVKVKVNLPNNVFVMDGNSEMSYSRIKSGEVKSIQLTLAANNNYSTQNIPITISIKEKYGKFAENKQLDIALNQTTSSSIKIAAKDEPQQERKEIQLALIKSDVDRNIPTTNASSPNTFVLILANEHYQQVATVPFALNDGNIFREYCVKTLGISEKHIKYISDATGNQMKAGINWLANLTEAFDNPQIIVYYAGHGIPDESSKTAYLLPVDGIISDLSTCYKLDDLYATLGKMPALQITVFMDACFSGSKREAGMLASARGVALKAKSGVPQGNMVVFSAAQGDETAYPNREQQHGLFTYYLLKKLQETQGDIALKDLGEYIIKQVSQQSLLINEKKQTPCVTPSASLGSDWQNWKLK